MAWTRDIIYFLSKNTSPLQGDPCPLVTKKEPKNKNLIQINLLNWLLTKVLPLTKLQTCPSEPSFFHGVSSMGPVIGPVTAGTLLSHPATLYFPSSKLYIWYPRPALSKHSVRLVYQKSVTLCSCLLVISITAPPPPLLLPIDPHLSLLCLELSSNVHWSLFFPLQQHWIKSVITTFN